MQVVEGCFSQTLAPTYKQDIANFCVQYEQLQQFATQMGKKLTVNWKIHVVAVHLETFLDMKGVGMARFAEQTSEAAHAALKPIEKRYLVSESNPKHPKALKKVASVFTSINV